MKNLSSYLVIALTLIFTSQAFAQHEVGNGGDQIRKGFILEGKEVLKRIDKTAAATALLLQNKITTDELKLQLDIQVIQVTEKILIDNTGSEVDALYVDPHIILNQERWSLLMNEDADLDLLILHELFRAIHFNDDNYVLSSEIIPTLPPQELETLTILEEATQYTQSQVYTPPCGIFCFPDADHEYLRGVQPEFKDLTGKWKLAGTVRLNDYEDNSMPNAYYENGINLQTSAGVNFYPHELEFKEAKDFSGNVRATVNILNLSVNSTSVNQGPVQVKVTQLGACFSQWSYGSGFSQMAENSPVLDNAYFHSGCRLLAGDPTKSKMFCAVRYQSPHTETLSPELRRLVGRTVYYLGYVKE